MHLSSLLDNFLFIFLFSFPFSLLLLLLSNYQKNNLMQKRWAGFKNVIKVYSQSELSYCRSWKPKEVLSKTFSRQIIIQKIHARLYYKTGLPQIRNRISIQPVQNHKMCKKVCISKTMHFITQSKFLQFIHH